MDSNVDDSGYSVCIGMAQNCDAGAESSCTYFLVDTRKFFWTFLSDDWCNVCCHFV